LGTKFSDFTNSSESRVDCGSSGNKSFICFIKTILSILAYDNAVRHIAHGSQVQYAVAPSSLREFNVRFAW